MFKRYLIWPNSADLVHKLEIFTLQCTACNVWTLVLTLLLKNQTKMHIVLDRELFKTTKAIEAIKATKAIRAIEAIKTVIPTWLASKKQPKVQSSIFVQNNEKKPISSLFLNLLIRKNKNNNIAILKSAITTSRCSRSKILQSIWLYDIKVQRMDSV